MFDVRVARFDAELSEGGALRVAISDLLESAAPAVMKPLVGRVDTGTKPFDTAISPVTPTPFADTVPGSTASTATINVGSSVDVTIDTPTDHDWYRVTLTAGVTYTIHSSAIAGGNNPDSYLYLRDAAGTLITEDDDSSDGTYSLISYTPTTTGTYFIDAGTYDQGGQSSFGSYHLSVAAGITGGDQVGGTTGTASSLTLNGSVNGRIDTNGDHDFYAITLTAGQTYIFRTGGVTAATATDTILTLRDAGGTQLASNDDAGEASFSAVRFTATTTGTYYLDVSGFGTATGDFNLTAFTTATPTLYTYDQIAFQLTNTYWGGASHRFAVTAGGSLTFNVQALAADGQTLARAALALWADVTGITFNEVTTGGQIVYDDNQTGAFANSSFSNGIISSSTVNVGTAWLTTYGTGLNTYSFQTYIHETGHALGLGHAGNYNGSASYASDSDYLNDSWATTVMSYFDQQENSYFAAQGFTREFVLTPMVGDGVAVTALYGTATTTRTGNTTYGFNNTSGQAIYDATQFPTISYTIYDNGGTDTLDYSGFTQNQVINLNPETFSNVGSRVGNVSIARGAVIENAIGGTGNDTITGNDVANTLTGGAGNDTLDGGLGADILIAGTGTDTLLGGGGDDGLYFGANYDLSDVVDGGAGSLDQLGLQGNYAGGVTLGSIAGIENVVLLSGATTTFGESGANRYSYALTTTNANVAAGQTLYVSANQLLATENFTFNGAAETDGSFITYGGLGTDTITGGQQNDGFYFGNGIWGASDSVNGQGGTLDQLGLQGNYSGASAITFGAGQLTGIEVIVLLSGTDARFGGGGAGFSYSLTMNDANVASGGFFAIQANALAASETLTFNASAETNAAITVFSGAGNDVITMGALGDTVFGGAGADTITGRAGADQLTGAAGNDSFVYLAVGDSTVAAQDWIKDFATGDKIDVGAIDADTVAASAQAFKFIGAAVFNAIGQLRATNTSGNDWLVEGDVNGDGTADLSIKVTSDHGLTLADFTGAVSQDAIALISAFQDSFDAFPAAISVVDEARTAPGHWFAKAALDPMMSHDFV